ncbi:MAG: ATP-binding protein [Methylococcaceae bacterium]
MGIALDNMERIFEPFFTTKSHRMGLGLAICRTIITAHTGQLWAKNNADFGASFYFTLTSYS